MKGRFRAAGTWFVLFAGLVPVAAQGARPGGGAGQPAWGRLTKRVSVRSTGAQGNDWSQVPSLSAEGRFVAFSSSATNLVAGDTNGVADVFVHDHWSGTTERVSVDSGGAQADQFSGTASISADGRHVAFWSAATNLVPGDTNACRDVFVRDRASGTTELVSPAGGAQANGDNGDSDIASISADGRCVAFWSSAANLVVGDTNFADDVFVNGQGSGFLPRR